MTRATTRRPWTRCSPRPDTPSSGRNRPAGASTVIQCSSASGSRPMSRSQPQTRPTAGAGEADMELDPRLGVWRVRGESGTELEWGKVAGHAGNEGLATDVLFVADGPTFPFGAHVAVVEVDTETGRARLVRHVTVDDAG